MAGAIDDSTGRDSHPDRLLRSPPAKCGEAGSAVIFIYVGAISLAVGVLTWEWGSCEVSGSPAPRALV